MKAIQMTGTGGPEVLQLVELPEAELATDIICGFPSETEEDHEATKALLETGAAGMAVDTLSLDYGISPNFATHYAWLPTNRWGLENIANLDAVPAKGATLTRMLRREDGLLDPRKPAAELERQVRAYQPWPGSFLEHDGARLKVWAASLLAQDVSVEPGVVILTEGTLGLGTVDGVLRLDEVQPAGSRRMSGAEYRRGKRL